MTTSTEAAPAGLVALTAQAARLVAATSTATAALLQRHLGVDWLTATAVLDRLQHAEIVGPAPAGQAGPRAVHITPADLPTVLAQLTSDGDGAPAGPPRGPLATGADPAQAVAVLAELAAHRLAATHTRVPVPAGVDSDEVRAAGGAPALVADLTQPRRRRRVLVDEQVVAR